VNYFALAVRTARDTFTYSPTIDPNTIALESLTITADAMPHHFIARAVIFDLQPADMVRAITTVEARIRVESPHFHSTGWRAASDGVWIYFTAWTPTGRHVDTRQQVQEATR
jgi:hypothetical protein